MKQLLIRVASFVLAFPALAGGKVFTPDANHTVLGFKASTELFDVSGRFERYKVEILGDPDHPSGSKVRMVIDARSLSTSNPTRDEHLRSPDFFDVARYPKITFTSERVWEDGGKLVVQGTLEMHGRSKDYRIPFTPAKGPNGAGAMTWSYKAILPINRLDFGVGNDHVAARISLKDQVNLELLLVGFFKDPLPGKAVKGKRPESRIRRGENRTSRPLLYQPLRPSPIS